MASAASEGSCEYVVQMVPGGQPSNSVRVMHDGGWMEFSNLGLWQSVCLAMSGELFVT